MSVVTSRSTVGDGRIKILIYALVEETRPQEKIKTEVSLDYKVFFPPEFQNAPIVSCHRAIFNSSPPLVV